MGLRSCSEAPRLKTVQAVDMFPRTSHVETVGLLSRE